MKIYILLPVHNRKEITRCFVECLVAQTFHDYHLILIDDGSSDGTEMMVREHIASLTLLRGDGELWWAGSLQLGLDWLLARVIDDDAVVLFINDDVLFAPDYLERAARVMGKKRGTFVLSQFRSPVNGQAEETGTCADLQRLAFSIADRPERINCLSTRGLFAYWADVRAVGGFRPRLLPHYLSDYEYTIRAHRRGIRCETNPELLLQPRHDTSGYRVFQEKSFSQYLKKYFSKRSVPNPLYWSIFAFLVCKPIWIFPNLARIWINESRNILRAWIASTKSNART